MQSGWILLNFFLYYLYKNKDMKQRDNKTQWGASSFWLDRDFDVDFKREDLFYSSFDKLNIFIKKKSAIKILLKMKI